MSYPRQFKSSKNRFLGSSQKSKSALVILSITFSLHSLACKLYQTWNIAHTYTAIKQKRATKNREIFKTLWRVFLLSRKYCNRKFLTGYDVGICAITFSRSLLSDKRVYILVNSIEATIFLDPKAIFIGSEKFQNEARRPFKLFLP